MSKFLVMTALLAAVGTAHAGAPKGPAKDPQQVNGPKAGAGTSKAADVSLGGQKAIAYQWADGVNPAPGNTSGFNGAFASSAASTTSTWSKLGSTAINGASLNWNYTVDASKKSGTFSISSNKAIVLDLTVAVHAGNASGAWLFDNLNLAANQAQTGTFAINWTNGGGQKPDFSNFTLFARDVKIASTGGIGGGPISPVPEADGYAMMIAALGMIGFMARRKRS